jgi:hypothetical protein
MLAAEKSVSIWKLLKTKDFTLLYLISFCQIFYGYYIISVYKTLASG